MVELRDLNDKVKKTITIPQANAEEVIKNPQEYGLEFIEITFAKYINHFKKAFESGKDMARKLEDGKKKR